MRTWMLTTPLLFSLCTLAVACDPEGGEAAAGEAPAEPTYAVDVAPILEANCAGCHTDPPTGGAPATVRLDTYADAAAHIDRVIARGVDGDPAAMPPGGLVLSDAEAQTLITWQETGTPE